MTEQGEGQNGPIRQSPKSSHARDSCLSTLALPTYFFLKTRNFMVSILATGTGCWGTELECVLDCYTKSAK